MSTHTGNPTLSACLGPEWWNTNCRHGCRGENNRPNSLLLQTKKVQLPLSNHVLIRVPSEHYLEWGLSGSVFNEMLFPSELQPNTYWHSSSFFINHPTFYLCKSSLCLFLPSFIFWLYALLKRHLRSSLRGVTDHITYWICLQGVHKLQLYDLTTDCCTRNSSQVFSSQPVSLDFRGRKLHSSCESMMLSSSRISCFFGLMRHILRN